MGSIWDRNILEPLMDKEKFLFSVLIDKKGYLVVRARKIRGNFPVNKFIIKEVIEELLNNPDYYLNLYERDKLEEILCDAQFAASHNKRQ